ncbi:MAG: shikimate kinase [Gemmatimonadales bacterium]
MVHVVLIGLPGAGKSTVGRLLADRLGTHWTDIDPLLERATGQTIGELFESEGEPAFRIREHRAVVEALRLPPHVVTPGGGWAAQPGNLAAVGEQGFVVHLAVDPAEAALRLAGDRSRPLLAGADPRERLTALSEQRLPWYRQAHAEVEVTGQQADAVAETLLHMARARAGWS